MESKLNLVLLALIGSVWATISLAEPEPLAAAPFDAELASLEDRFARDRSRSSLALELADRYLAREMPGLAVSTLSSAAPAVREDPAVLHRLAMGYEEIGRIDDAFASAQLAVARCARAIGTGNAITPVPAHRCSERTYASLETHRTALGHMARWGVTDVQHDPRARHAYVIATRSARIFSAAR